MQPGKIARGNFTQSQSENCVGFFTLRQNYTAERSGVALKYHIKVFGSQLVPVMPRSDT
jgi:hypothetical protein